jgi:hypothetical protein
MTRVDHLKYKLIKMRTTYAGTVGIPDVQAKEALDRGQDLLFVKEQEQMIVTNDEIGSRIVGKSKDRYQDRRRNRSYRLIYYQWKPDKNPQEPML